MRRISAFTFALLSSTAIFTAPAKADVQLEELKARLERAQKENLILKAEKIEKENLTIKAEALEAENAAMRNAAKAAKAVASIPQRSEPSTPVYSKPQRIVVKQSENNENTKPKENLEAFKAVDKAITSIPKNDERRELVAVSKAAFDPTPIKQWQGIYAGINGGYGYGSQYGSTVAYGTQAGTATGSIEPAVSYGYGTSAYNGGFAGGQVGYNQQFKNNLILGGELDLDWADVNSNNTSGSSNNASYQAGNTRSQVFKASGRTGLDWIGTARIRVGYALGNFLPYITGGVAYGGLSSNSNGVFAFASSRYTSSTDYYSSFYGNGATANGSTVGIGWVAGAGAEYMVAPNWSVKGEYLYTQLSGYNVKVATLTPQYQSGVGYTNYALSPFILGNSHLSPYGVHQARVGLNYHTGWLGSSPTVLAKY